MSTSKNKRAVVVGIFTVIGIAIFTIGIFSLKSWHKLFANTVTVNAFFTDVNGLQAGVN